MSLNSGKESKVDKLQGRVRVKNKEILTDRFFTLSEVTIDYLRRDGHWQEQKREVLDRGDGAVVLLYDLSREKILLIRQLRLPLFLAGYERGLIEACAGSLDKDDPETCIKKEILEETGYQVSNVIKVFEAYMSPGAVSEKLHFFIAEYSADDRKGKGGGLKDEGEDIEVLELNFKAALNMVINGEIIDAKTLMLIQYMQISNIF